MFFRFYSSSLLQLVVWNNAIQPLVHLHLAQLKKVCLWIKPLSHSTRTCSKGQLHERSQKHGGSIPFHQFEMRAATDQDCTHQAPIRSHQEREHNLATTIEGTHQSEQRSTSYSLLQEKEDAVTSTEVAVAKRLILNQIMV